MCDNDLKTVLIIMIINHCYHLWSLTNAMVYQNEIYTIEKPFKFHTTTFQNHFICKWGYIITHTIDITMGKWLTTIVNILNSQCMMNILDSHIFTNWSTVWLVIFCGSNFLWFWQLRWFHEFIFLWHACANHLPTVRAIKRVLISRAHEIHENLNPTEIWTPQKLPTIC